LLPDHRHGCGQPNVSEFCRRTRQVGKPEALPDQPNGLRGLQQFLVRPKDVPAGDYVQPNWAKLMPSFQILVKCRIRPPSKSIT
jgi:hypothetical protein